jgi:multidrug efflux pump subunit AcrB
MPKHNTHKHEVVSYLSRIRFDPKLLSSSVAKYISNIRIVILLVITIFLLGLVNYFQLPRRLNPEIKIPIVSVFTLLPGASPEDIETLVTVPLENELKGVDGLDQITSSSTNSVSSIVLQFVSTVSQDKAKDAVTSAIEGISGLPGEAEKPVIKGLDFEDVPVWTFALQGKSDDPASLQSVSQMLKERLEDDPKVDRVLLVGQEDQEVTVELMPEKIQEYDISPLDISRLVGLSLSSFPAGTVSSATNTFSLTIDPLVVSIADIRNIRITINETPVRLGDIAYISERTKPAPRLAFIADQKTPASRIVTFDVYKTQSANIDEGYTHAKKVVDDYLSQYKDSFSVKTITNAAEMIDEQFFDLLGEFRSTIFLVFACLLLFLGIRQAIISCLTVPLTFLCAFIFMRAFGMSINFLSLFAFLLTLGLLVDDTIVVVSAMTTYFKTRRFTPLQTGILVWRDTIVPIWSTTITTIWSFVPLLLSTGIIGEFIKPIPIVVTVTMISSTAIAVLITLPFMIVLLKPVVASRVLFFGKILMIATVFGFLAFVASGNPFFIVIAILFFLVLFLFSTVQKIISIRIKKRLSKQKNTQKLLTFVHTYSNKGFIDLEKISHKYYRFIYRILSSKTARRKVIVAIVLYALFSFLLVPFGLVKTEFFPKSDNETLYVSLELPNGTRYEQMLAENSEFLNELRNTPYSNFVVGQIGTSISLQNGAAQENSGSILYTIHLPKQKDRPISSIDIAQRLRNTYATYPKGKVNVIEESGGPPAGADLQIKLSGNDLRVLDSYADQVISYLSSMPGITNIEKSIKVGTSALVFEPDYQQIAKAGTSVDAIGLWLRTYASGFTLDEANLSTQTLEKQNIVLRMSKTLPLVTELSQLSIPTKNSSYPLTSLGTLKTKTNPTVITRDAGKRTVSVSAAVQSGHNIADLNKKLETFADSLTLDPGYSWSTGGVNEENQKSVQSIFQAMIVSFILIMVTMVLQFQSYRQAAIVLVVIPLAVSSVFFIFALTGTPLSFPALIGVLSLFGIVVTNSMFIVDKINLNLKEKMGFKEAIADAGATRLEPIVLTKLCTVLGLLPVTIADPLWRGLGGAIISGILLASSIMLLFIPVVYYETFKNEAPK